MTLGIPAPERSDSVLGEGLITGVLGPRRGGKSLVAAKLCYEAHLRGMKVFHTGNLLFGEKIERLDILLDQDPTALNSCLVYIDEVKSILPSARSSSTFSRLIDSNFIQAGHQALSVLWTTPQDSGVDRNLLHVTDFAMYVDGPRSGTRRWTDLKGMTPHEYKERHGRTPVACPASDPDSPWHYAHTGSGLMGDCRDIELQRSIKVDVFSQSWSRLGAKKMRSFIVGCAQRYYNLFDTTYKVDAAVAQLTSSDDLRERQSRGVITKLRTLMHSLYTDQDIEKCNPIDLLEYLEGTYGEVVGDSRLARMCSTLGVPKRRTSGGVVYNLKGFVEKERKKAKAEA
jgi:hypothetical protein